MRLNEFSSDLGARTHYILAKQSWVLDDHQEKNQAATKGATVERVDSAHLVTQVREIASSSPLPLLTFLQENPDAVARSLAGFLDRLGPVTGQAKL